ncbi:MAG: hypothetical protein NTZ09_02845 [Candidatus Hydrogenedentes bacterium]|nr:hypothetical protein [Candidatus Hydrogenedentota bacterium]
MPIDPKALLNNIPAGLRKSLFDSFQSIEKNYREKHWEPSELNGGKMCEVVYSILEGHVEGKFPSKPTKPRNMVDACKNLEQADGKLFSRSVRIQIPRMLIALYEIRNNRGVGHVGGDVDPNHMDAVVVVNIAKWIFAEVIRLFHGVTTEEASEAVDCIIEREIPLVWEVGKVKRILNPSLSMKDKTLALLFTCVGPVRESDLVTWTEHSNGAVFRRDVLKKAHKAKLIEYDANKKEVQLSPLGEQYVQANINLALDGK